MLLTLVKRVELDRQYILVEVADAVERSTGIIVNHHTPQDA
jgi:hypothetical protein